MDIIWSLLKEIFTGKDMSNTQIGLSEYKHTVKTPVEKVTKNRPIAKEIRISELMRKSSC